MHRNRGLRSRFNALLGLLLQFWVAWAAWGAVWYFGRWLPYWEFSLIGALVVLVREWVRDQARIVRRAQSRTRVWVLPVRDGGLDRPDAPDGGGTETGPRLGLPGGSDQGRDER